MVTRWRSADIALSSDHARKARNGTSDYVSRLDIVTDGRKYQWTEESGNCMSSTLVYLTKDNHARKLGLGVSGDRWVEYIYSWEQGLVNL